MRVTAGEAIELPDTCLMAVYRYGEVVRSSLLDLLEEGYVESALDMKESWIYEIPIWSSTRRYGVGIVSTLTDSQ